MILISHIINLLFLNLFPCFFSRNARIAPLSTQENLSKIVAFMICV